MKELTREEKLKVIENLNAEKYEDIPLCAYVLSVIWQLYPEYDDGGDTWTSVLFPEVYKTIRDEGNKKAGHKKWLTYGYFIREDDELLTFRREVLQKIINLKNQL